ncbi:LysR family transcriptional regulator [Neptunomonas japonica]|uniref:LysR family transcriptional regulator n=1 Tax=Neptunomonas japonica TaxID=417574 RepID=UPI00041DF45F|nr:LysR family transcriptional regulator [Neptunomonas japonica]
MNWNDLKYFLALYRNETLAGAAKTLKVNSTTVARRIVQLELDLGCRLFDRPNGRYVITVDAEDILQTALQLEIQFGLINQQLNSRDKNLSGIVRITSVSTFINGYLLKKLPDFQRRYPDIQLELIADASQLSLSQREADIAIRMGRPETGQLIISKLTDIAYAVYGNKDTQPETTLSNHPWVILDDKYANLPEAKWVRQHVSSARPVLRTNVGLGSVEAVKQGIGVACLPCYLASHYQLRPLTKTFSIRELWLLQHPKLLELTRIRVFIDWLKGQLLHDKELFKNGS